MTDTYERRTSEADDEEMTQQLLRLAGGRPEVSPARQARVRAAVHDEWRAAMRQRRIRRRALGLSGLGAAASLAVLVWWWAGGTRPAITGTPLATVERIDGPAYLDAQSTESEVPLFRDNAVHAEDQIRTSTEGRVSLRFTNGPSVRLDIDSRVRLLSTNVIDLQMGAVYVDTGDAGAEFEVQTARGTARDLGTQFEVRLLDDAVRLRVRAGTVILSDSDRSATARAGTELTMTSSSITSRAMASDADAWAWTARVAPPVDFEGLALAEFLARLAREEGWTVRYEDDGLAREAAGIVLHGSASGLSARQAVEVAISTSGLEHRFEGRELAILRRASQR